MRAILVALLAAGCQAAGPGPWLSEPTAALSYPVGSLTLRIAPEPFHTASLAGSGVSIRATVQAPDMPATASIAVPGALDAARLTISGVPAGKGRLVILQAMDASAAPIPGARFSAVTDVGTGSQTVEVSPRSTVVGDVFGRLYETQAGRTAVASLSINAVGSAVDRIKLGPPRLASYASVDGTALAEAITSGGALPVAVGPFQIIPGTVKVTVMGGPPGLPLEIRVGDPVSGRVTGVSHDVSQSSDLYEVGPVLPGTWPIRVLSPGMADISGSVTVNSGVPTAFTADFSTWRVEPSLPVPVGDMAVAAIGNRVFAIGGVVQGGRATDSVFVLDTGQAAPAWQRLAPMITAREGAAIGVVGGRIVVAGGHGTNAGGTFRFQRTEIYDPVTNTWISGSQMPAGFVPATSTGFAWGGMAGASNGSQLLVFNAVADLNSTLAISGQYDPSLDFWTNTTPPAPPTPRLFAAAAILSGRLYLAGGFKPQNPITNPGNTILLPYVARREVEAFDLGTGVLTWKTLAPLPTGRSELGLAASRTKLYAVGGVAASTKPLATVEVFDPLVGTWRPAGPMRAPRSAFGLVAANGRLWAVGGAPARELSSNNGGSAIATSSVESMPLPEGTL